MSRGRTHGGGGGGTLLLLLLVGAGIALIAYARREARRREEAAPAAIPEPFPLPPAIRERSIPLEPPAPAPAEPIHAASEPPADRETSPPAEPLAVPERPSVPSPPEPPRDVPVRTTRRTSVGPPLPAELPPILHPLLEAPEAVTEGEAFEVLIGLSVSPVPGIAGDEIALPPGAREVTLRVTVRADEFSLKEGELTSELVVRGGAPPPAVSLVFAPAGHREQVRAGTVEATFAHEGGDLGQAAVLVLSRPV